jgi:hypothetical protein
MDMRVPHRTTGIPLWPPCGPAHHLGHEVLEPRSGQPMMRLIDLWFGVQPRIVLDTVNQVIDDGGNRIDAPSRS